MNMAEACTLAAEIEADPDYLVIAIGRFQIIADLLRGDADSFPWYVSVIARNRADGVPTKIGDHSAWQTYRDMTSDSAPMRPAEPRKASAKRRDESHMRQPTLF